MADNSILEPVKLYNQQFKDKFNENCEKYFDELVEKSGINIEENRQNVKKYRKQEAYVMTIESKVKKSRILRGIIIALLILAIIFIVYSILEIAQTTPKVVIIVVSALVSIISIYGIVKFNKKLKNLDKTLNNERSKLKKYLDVCWETMRALNESYDWSIPSDLMEMTTPLIDLDHYFDTNKFEYLHEKYGFKDNINPNQSTNYVLSGNINGNPFVLINSYNTELRNKIYTGSITIHWTTIEHTKNGTRTVSHSEVLTASIERPAPVYFYDTRLVFGNDAAPNLEFSRMPTLKNKNASDKDIDKMVRHGEKQLAKLSQKAVAKGGQFNAMANSKFEVLFNALNRTNEVEYRLMFTPLAQTNMVDLIRNDPYGDDFAFYKDKCLNYIISSHSQSQDYRVDPQRFEDFDFDAAKAKFKAINTEFFRGLYYDLAPLLAIPIYQQTKTHEYIYDIPYEAYNTKFEQESLANRMDRKEFLNPLSKTDAILKCNFKEKDEDTDYITVTAHSYKTEPRVAYETKLGGDGKLHTIPIHWDEYIPISKDTDIAMSKIDTTRQKFRNSNEFINKLAANKELVFERGLVSYIVACANSSMKDIKDNINKKEEEN